jgi:hypothetical protein
LLVMMRSLNECRPIATADGVHPREEDLNQT